MAPTWNGCCRARRPEALLELTREIATKELAPQVAEAEERAEFPAAAYRLLGKSGLLSLPFAEEYGGGGQPYEVYLQVVEEIATAWPSVGVGTSVHSLTATVVAANAAAEQQAEWLPRMLGGDWLGAYCLSEPQAGSDVSAIRTRAVRGRRRVRRERHQAVDQQRLLRRLLHPLRPHRRRPASAACRRSS